MVAYNEDDREIASDTIQITVISKQFIRGDANLNGKIDIADAIHTLLHVGQGFEVPCRDALDADDTGVIDITDGIVIIEYLFLSGDPMPAPFPSRGDDPTADDLDCETGL